MTPETIPYSDGETKLTGLLYRPSGEPRAAIIVYPTIMNQEGVVLKKAASLAEHGYLAFLADFYGKNPENFEQSREFAAEIRPQPQDFRRRVRQGLAGLGEHGEPGRRRIHRGPGIQRAPGIRLVERRPMPPLGHFSLIRFGKDALARAA